MTGGRVTIGSLETQTLKHEGELWHTRKVKLDVPSFDGKIDATPFSDWLVAMEEYFDWYEVSDTERLWFAKMKLVVTCWKILAHYYGSP